VRPKANMSLEVFDKCMELVRRSDNPEYKGRKFVWLNHFGEPLLNPELPRFIARAADFGVEVSFSSNGVDNDKRLFPRALWRTLAEAGLKGVILSAHVKSVKKLKAQVDGIVEVIGVWEPRREQIHTWAGQIDYTPERVGHAPDPSPQPCDYENDDMFAVTWDGRIAACCYDIEARTGLTVDDVLRDGFRFNPVSLCSSCTLGRGDAEWIDGPLQQILG